MRGVPGPYPVHRSVGDVEVIAIADATLVLDSAETAPGIAIAELLRECDGMVTGEGRFHCTVTCYVIRSSGRTVVFDTGIGNRGDFGLPHGQLDLALEEVGISPRDVDVVVNSHLHFDHVGWNTVDDTGGGVRAFFPNALHDQPRGVELDDDA